jgi:glycosyltransferase involved in cell wall biosynthesis
VRLLILSFSYAPRSNPRATRWTTLAEHFAREGHSVTVVTSWQQGLPEHETSHGVQVYRVGMRSLERLRRTLSASRPTSKREEAPGADIASGELKFPSSVALRLLRAFNRMIWRNLWWPDSACIWLRPALKTARRLLVEQPVDAVISVSPAFSAVVAGHILSRDRQHRWRWIIDLGDPFSFMDLATPNNALIYGWLNCWIEHRAFLRADGISVTTDITRQIYSLLYPTCAGKITVIPPLLSPPSEPAVSAPFFRPSTTTRLVFIGTLYQKLRRPDYLLKLFSAMRDLYPEFDCELHLIGDTRECKESLVSYQNRLGERLIVHAPIDRSLAAQAMSEADILVNLGNATTYQLPSKLVEYAATGKPIISISDTTTDSSEIFLSSYPRALCMSDIGRSPTTDQINQFAVFCTNRNGHGIAPSVLEKFLYNYKARQVADLYEKLWRQ